MGSSIQNRIDGIATSAILDQDHRLQGGDDLIAWPNSEMLGRQGQE